MTKRAQLGETVRGCNRTPSVPELTRLDSPASFAGDASTMTIREGACGILLAIALTGCERVTSPQAQDTSAPALQHLALAARWSFETGKDEASLSVLGADAKALFRIACVRSPARLEITVPGFAVIPSEERLTLGVDNEAFLLVAEVVGRPARGVRAEAQIPADLLNRFPATRDVSAVYGAATAGPYLPPLPEQTDAFVTACRGIAG
jgi:hypothetical protein